MSKNEKRQNKKPVFQEDILEYQAFLQENQKNVNLLLNKFLRFSMLTGPSLVLLIRLGIFQNISYTMCIVVTIFSLLITCLHYVLIKHEGNTILAAVMAFLALDSLLIMMNSAHI